MVCVLLKEDAPPDKLDMLKKNLCTMAHVFGTNSWREIPQVPSYPTKGKAIFANGFLHWLASYSDIKTEDGVTPLIWFDVKKEEFGLIDPPKRMHDITRNYSCLGQVVDLNEIVPDALLIDVIVCWNKDGDILIKSIGGDPVRPSYGKTFVPPSSLTYRFKPHGVLALKPHEERMGATLSV
nr:hypothetical protein [Tanacetum cinerariifolium]